MVWEGKKSFLRTLNNVLIPTRWKFKLSFPHLPHVLVNAAVRVSCAGGWFYIHEVLLSSWLPRLLGFHRLKNMGPITMGTEERWNIDWRTFLPACIVQNTKKKEKEKVAYAGILYDSLFSEIYSVYHSSANSNVGIPQRIRWQNKKWDVKRKSTWLLPGMMEEKFFCR